MENACAEDWSAMGRAGQGRHCRRCATDVVDLTRVTRSQAEAILRAAGGTVCGRVRSDAHGALVFAPEPVRRGILPVAVAGLLAACASEPDPAADVADVAVASTDVGPAGLALSTTRPGRFGGSIATGVMMPVGPDAPLVVSPASATPVPTIAATEDEGDVTPTAEQRAQTRRKRWQRQVHAHPPPPPHHWMGMMVLDD